MRGSGRVPVKKQHFSQSFLAGVGGTDESSFSEPREKFTASEGDPVFLDGTLKYHTQGDLFASCHRRLLIFSTYAGTKTGLGGRRHAERLSV